MQAWLLALLSHLALRLVWVVCREVWGEEFELLSLDLEEETVIDKVETETMEVEQGRKGRTSWRDEGEDSDLIFERDTGDEGRFPVTPACLTTPEMRSWTWSLRLMRKASWCPPC